MVRVGYGRLMRDLSDGRLDQLTLDVEFLLVSIIQGIALTTLVNTALPLMLAGRWFDLPYVVTAFLLILFFWSQSIIHALSFVRWPIQLFHSFLYFVVAFFEILLLTQVDDPKRWFLTGVVFFFSALPLYAYDLKLMLQQLGRVAAEQQRRVLRQMITNQREVMLVIIPFGIVFNLAAFWLTLYWPELFIGQHRHILLGGVQAVIGLLVLCRSVVTFQNRSSQFEQLSP